jgi:hypothetical protein
MSYHSWQQRVDRERGGMKFFTDLAMIGEEDKEVLIKENDSLVILGTAKGVQNCTPAQRRSRK